MPFDDQLEKRLTQLKKAYEQQPQVTNINELVSKIRLQNHKRKKKRFVPVFSSAAVIAMICIIIVAIPEFLQSPDDETYSNELYITSEQPAASDSKKLESFNDAQIVKKDVVEIEGMPEEMTFFFVENEHLNISTYYPEDLIVNNEESKLMFYANFNGKEERAAYVEIIGMNASAVSNEQTDVVFDMFQDYAISEKQKNDFTFPFSEQEYKIEKGDYVGVVSLYQHDDKLFRITIHCPLEYEEGFIPRAIKTISEIEFQE